MKTRVKRCLTVVALSWFQLTIAHPSVERIEALPDRAKTAPTFTVSRVLQKADDSGSSLHYQWPGTYFETAFKGSSAYFKLGPGDVILRVLIDDQPVTSMVKPAPGFYEIRELGRGPHRVRIEVVTESQAGSNEFGGFYLPKDSRPVRIRSRSRQIEFIGDSHTVGYGNTFDGRECTEEQVWSSTDTSQAFGPIVARHFGADYQINAISGRGIVRNYNGGSGDPLPQAYPFVLFDRADVSNARRWRPDWIVISLGTNDFSTKLHEGEPWKSREELHAAFESTFVRFARDLRTKHPRAHLLLWATDSVNTEIRDEAQKVVAELVKNGERKIDFVAVPTLTMNGCHWHPSSADDQTIANILIEHIEARDRRWKRP